jgi:hypothetical protein
MERGATGGPYLKNVTDEDVATALNVRRQFYDRLRRSRERPQVITVGGRANEAYAIVPLDVLTRLIEAAGRREESFVPITQLMRESDGFGGLPPSTMPQRKRRGRPDPGAVIPAIKKS